MGNRKGARTVPWGAPVLVEHHIRFNGVTEFDILCSVNKIVKDPEDSGNILYSCAALVCLQGDAAGWYWRLTKNHKTPDGWTCLAHLNESIYYLKRVELRRPRSYSSGRQTEFSQLNPCPSNLLQNIAHSIQRTTVILPHTRTHRTITQHVSGPSKIYTHVHVGVFFLGGGVIPLEPILFHALNRVTV